MHATPAALLAELDRIITGTEAEARRTMAGWEHLLAGSAYRASAENLARYLALRRHDLTALQPALSALGLSSLGRSEAHVAESLGAVRSALACLAGGPPPSFRSPLPDDPTGPWRDALFGGPSGGRDTRIMATLPSEAAADPALAAAYVAAGMDCARINCAHDGPADWRAMAGHVRAAAAAAGRHCRILMDIAGPKLRLAEVRPPDAPRLYRGDRMLLLDDIAAHGPGDPPAATLAHAGLLGLLTPGEALWIDDGKLGARVIEAAPGRVLLEVTHARAQGKRLRPEKGINLPGLALPIAPLTSKDLDDLDSVAGLADCVGFSFVQRPQDVAWLARELDARRPGQPPMPIVLKVETALAVRHLPALIVQGASDRPLGVMIARGDLAVEIGFPRLSEIQEEILWLCEAAHVPVVWATEVFANLVRDGRPSRAETTDAAMAQRAECVMLNKGPFLAEAIATMADVLTRMDRHQSKKRHRLPALASWPEEALALPPLSAMPA